MVMVGAELKEVGLGSKPKLKAIIVVIINLFAGARIFWRIHDFVSQSTFV